MIEPHDLYPLIEDTTHAQEAVRGVFHSARNAIDKHILAIWEVATSPANMHGTLMSLDDVEGIGAGKEWRDKCARETEAKDGVAVYLSHAVEGYEVGRVVMLPRSMAKWLLRCWWVRKATQSDVDKEVELQRAAVHPRPMADIGKRLATARRIHDGSLLPHVSGEIAGRHPLREDGRERVLAA